MTPLYGGTSYSPFLVPLAAGQSLQVNLIIQVPRFEAVYLLVLRH